MIPRTYPSLTSAAGTFMRVTFLASVTGLTKWIDYIPVKTVAYSTTAAETTNSGGHLTVMPIESTSVFMKWVDYIPVYEDASATVAWGTGDNGYLPVCQALNLDFTIGVLDSRITFTRADATSCATYFDSTGRLQTAAANVARFDYDPATLQPRGLLIEEARTNLLTYSRDITNVIWGKTDVTPTRNQVGIDGTANSACLITEGISGTCLSIQSPATAVTAGSTLTGSIVLKRGNCDWVRLIVADATGTDGVTAWFNLATGAKGQVAARGAGTSNSSTITNLGGGWYRCTATTVPNGTYTLTTFRLTSASGDGVAAVQTSATYIVDCAQLEVGSFATSIITTTAATVTRAADSASMTGTNFSSWFNATQGTFVAEFDVGATVGDTSSRVIAGVGTTAATDNIYLLRQSNSANIGYNVTTAGVNQAGGSVGTTTVGAITKATVAYATNDFAATSNGVAPATDSAGSVPTVTQLAVGNGPWSGATNFLNGHIRRLTYYPTRLSNAQLQALTT